MKVTHFLFIIFVYLFIVYLGNENNIKYNDQILKLDNDLNSKNNAQTDNLIKRISIPVYPYSSQKP